MPTDPLEEEDLPTSDRDLRGKYERDRQDAWRNARSAHDPIVFEHRMKLVDAATQDCLYLEGVIRRRGMSWWGKAWDLIWRGP